MMLHELKEHYAVYPELVVRPINEDGTAAENASPLYEWIGRLYNYEGPTEVQKTSRGQALGRDAARAAGVVWWKAEIENYRLPPAEPAN